ncbi:MAG: hypothetical protein J6P64_07115 [Bacteroidales bacterium]|nr:hypothetical protein [Bacteroidales bacterium]
MDEKTKTQKEQKKDKRRNFLSQMWTIILGTTISLIVTIVAAQILERNHRAKDRRLSAMMVMSNIESYAQILESAYAYMEHADTVSAWLLNLPLDKVDSFDQDSLLSLMDEVMYIPIFVYDKTTEGIFSDDIETWKNMGNFQFIDNVGKCFSNMHTIEEEWTAFSEEMDEVRDAVLYHPEQYTGSSWSSKYLNEPVFRQILRNFHNRRCWLQNKIEKIRYHNYVNMVTIGITEQELLEFIEMREKEIEVDRERPGDILYTPNINPDSITTIHIPLSETEN